MKKVAAVIFLSLLMQRTDGFVFSNAMDGVMDFKCPPHQFISYVGGHHDNHYEDRQYEFRCTDVPVAEASFTQEICAWTASFVNNFDEPVIFECSNSGYLSGVYSEHDNRYEDRRFKFYCCSIPGYHMDDCEYSGQVNQYDGPMAYSLPTGKVMKGAVSVHDNGHEYVRKTIFRAKHTVTSTRKGTADDKIWHPDDVYDGKVEMLTLTLRMPVLIPSLTTEDRLLSLCSLKSCQCCRFSRLPHSHPSEGNGRFTWQISTHHGLSATRHVFVAFQHMDWTDNQERSAMIFDKVGASEVSLWSNGHQEPTKEILPKFTDNQVARVYHKIWPDIHRHQNVDRCLQNSHQDFSHLYPIYYVSLEHLELHKQSMVDMYCHARVNPTDPPLQMHCYDPLRQDFVVGGHRWPNKGN